MKNFHHSLKHHSFYLTLDIFNIFRNVCIKYYSPKQRRVLNPIKDGGRRGKKSPPTSFSPITSTNVGTNPQSFLSYSFDPFVTLL